MGYYESVEHDVIEALSEITKSESDLLNEDNYDVLREILDSYDLTGNMDASYFCSLLKAKEALTESEDTLQTIKHAVYHGYMTYAELGSMICNEEWENLDVLLRIYVYDTNISDWIYDYINN